jgi:hypothetical protein
VYKHITADVWLYHRLDLWRIGMLNSYLAHGYAEGDCSPMDLVSPWLVPTKDRTVGGGWVDSPLTITTDLFDAFQFNTMDRVQVVRVYSRCVASAGGWAVCSDAQNA